MLRALTEAAQRFRAEGALLPDAYKQKPVNWIIDLSVPWPSPQVLGPFRGQDTRRLPAPDRQRSGKIGPDNLKPYLLADDGRYALGISEPGKAAEATLAHGAFIQLLEAAQAATRDPELDQVLEFLASPAVQQAKERIGPRDVVTFRCNPTEFPFERKPIQQFWATYLGDELLNEAMAACAVCGRSARTLRVLPNEVVVLGQKCQVTSFNSSAFCSLGKRQTANAPLCYPCAASAIEALKYLTGAPQHRAILSRDESRSSRANPLRNQVAVFWLKAPEQAQHSAVEIDIEALLGALLAEAPLQAPNSGSGTPPAELAQLEALLRVPWTPRESARHLDPNAFYLAVLSANKGRLVVREWIDVSLANVREHLLLFLDAQRIVGPEAQTTRAFPLPALLAALGESDPNLVRELLRTAYLGTPPPGLLAPAVRRFRVPKTLAPDTVTATELIHALAAVLKLALTHGKEDAARMEHLDRSRHIPAYLCGRLLSILEEAQRRAGGGRLNATLVDRYYGGASTTPATTLGQLLNRAQASHLPQVRRERRGHGQMEALLEEVLTQLDLAGGFPKTLSLVEQADFALGFYHQRAVLRVRTAEAQSEALRATQGDEE